jgi:hypothetical protein
MTAFDPRVAAAIAESGIPMSADLAQEAGRERAEAAAILDRAADHIRQFGLDEDRHVIGAIATVAYGDPAAPISARGGAPDRARTHLFWHLGVPAFANSLAPTAGDAERVLRDAAAALRSEAAS